LNVPLPSNHLTKESRMPDHNIVTRLLETPGFGWQCGEPLRDKGSYFRCSCGCSQPDEDSDGYLTILQPKILREAAQEIERLRTELKEAKARNTLYLSRLQEHEAREQ
jgi:hypothetical protein